MNTATAEKFTGATYRLGAVAILIMTTVCACENSPSAGPHAANTVRIIPDYTDNPGPRPTKIIVSADSPIKATTTTISQNGPDSIIIKFAPQGPYVPTASVSPHP